MRGVVYAQGRATADLRGQYSRGPSYRCAVRRYAPLLVPSVILAADLFVALLLAFL